MHANLQRCTCLTVSEGGPHRVSLSKQNFTGQYSTLKQYLLLEGMNLE